MRMPPVVLICLAVCSCSRSASIDSSDWTGASAPAPSNIRAKIYVVAHLHRYDNTGSGDVSDRLRRIELIQQIGATGTRLGFEWGDIQPQQGSWDWTLHDSLIAELTDAGLRVYGMIGYAASWARPPDAPRAHRPVIAGSAAKGDTSFAAFAAAVARRYQETVDHWEIWNEPNIPPFWIHVVDDLNRGPDPSDYLRLFELARDSILATNQTATVIMAGLASGQGIVRRVTDPTDRRRKITVLPAHAYLRELLGAGASPPVIGLHPYSNVAPGVVRKGESVPAFPEMVLDSVFHVLDAFDLSTTQVWVTEWGVNQRIWMSDSDASEWFRVGLRELLCNDRIPIVTVYALTDEARIKGLALVNASGQRTAQGNQLRSMLTKWPGC